MTTNDKLKFTGLTADNMSLTEMSLTERQIESRQEEDVYDDGYLRVEHKSYYVACGGQPIKFQSLRRYRLG